MGTYRMYRLRHSLRLFVLLLTVCFGVSGRLFGQYYPIHATVQWPAPQSPYLVDYSTGSRDRLIVTLLNRDLQQPLLYAKLRLQIKSGSFTARSREEVSYPQLELQTSVPLRLTGVDLSPYLQPQHLQMTGRLEQGRLPSGYAELQLQVIDYYTGRPLSDWHTARAYLDIEKPPFLNLPERDAEVALRDPLFLRFQWTPRHQGLSGTEYEFVLKELPDNGAAPQSAFVYGQEIFRAHTRSTSLSYTHLDPPLLPNRRYAWQVRALVRSGVEEVGMFEHGGLSEVSWFYLNDQCDAPRGLRAQTRYAKVDLSWGKVVGTTGYVVECRPKTKLNVYEWARTETAEERLTLAQLKPGWTYEWRVGTRCTSDRPVFSDVREFTLSKQNEALLADCGKEPVRTDLRGEPHLGIRAGDVVTIGGDYPMTITEVTALGDGWYSGKGKTRLKTLIDAPIALSFDRLRINVDKYQIDGSVEASYDEKRGTIANTDYIDDGGRDLRPATLRLREKQLSFTLPEHPQFHFDAGTGTLTVQDAAGNAQRIDLQLPEGEEYKSVFPLLVTDKEGNSYRIQPAVASTEDDHDTSSTHGKVALQSERVERMGDFDSEALSKMYGQIRFSGQGGRYAFDPGSVSWYQKSIKLDRFYKPFAKDYIAPWKLIPEGAQDVVTAEYTGNKAIDPQRVRFASEPRSTALPASYDASSKRWSVSLPSVSSGESYEVFAVYEGEVLGKLRVASYAQQRHKLTLVPINDTKHDEAQIERELNGVYGSVGIRFDVEVDERMRGDYSWDRDGDRKLSIVGKNFFGRVREVKESAEMDYLKKTYTQLVGTLDGLYLFVVDAAQGLEDKPQSLLGEMPRRSRFGYIFSGNSPNGGTSDLSYTIAHELGHGLFTLQHTFDDEYGGRKSQGQTDNLMDYAAGKELAAFQWNVLTNPAVFTVADKVEEGELGKMGTIWLTPDWEPFIYDASNRILRVSPLSPNGTIDGISLNSKSDSIYKYNKLTRCYEYNLNGRVDTLPVQYVVSIQDDQVVHLVDRDSGVSGVVYKAKWGDIKHSVNDSSLFLSSAVSFLREVGSNQVDDCPKIHVQYIARYICDEIKKNVETSEVKLIRAANILASNSTHRDPLKGEQPEVILKIVGNLIAYMTWGYKVKSGAEWDHKKKIREMQKGIVYSCDKSSLNPLQFSYDLWSNIHYGFIGAYAGFTEVELLVGAGVAQVFDNSPEQLEGNAEVNRRIYDALSNRLGAENDDPSDQQAILIGIRLYSEFKNRMSSFSSNDILRAVYRLYKQGLPISVKKCDNH